MPKAKNIKERVTQVARWLKSEWELEKVKRIEWIDCSEEADYQTRDDALYGYVLERDNYLVIRLCERCCRTRALAIETLIHEMAHAALWDEGLGYYHGPLYWTQYGEFQDAYEHHGYSDSMSQSPL